MNIHISRQGSLVTLVGILVKPAKLADASLLFSGCEPLTIGLAFLMPTRGCNLAWPPNCQKSPQNNSAYIKLHLVVPSLV